MGHREKYRQKWLYDTFKGKDRNTVHLYTAPHWNVSHIKNEVRYETNAEIGRRFDHWKETNDRFDWAYLGNEGDGDIFIIYDKNDRRYHPPKVADVTHLVYNILRNGTEREEAWDTGQKETISVWST